MCNGLIMAALVALLVAGAAAPALARQGLYAGVGLGEQSITSGIDGTRTYTAAPNTIEVGKPESGRGLAFTGGFGLNEYVALDLLLNVSGHDTVFDPSGVNHTYKAELSSVLFGVKVGVPLGDVAEVFGRAGLGGYELTYSQANLDAGTAVDDARFSGRGVALGVGAELFFGKLGMQIAYTVHNVDFKTVQSKNFGGSVNPALKPTISAVSLLLTYYLQ